MAKKKSRRSAADENIKADENGQSKIVDFEDALSEVQQIVAKLEGGEAGLGESLELYEAGIKRLKECHALLRTAERKISLLSGFDADGNPITEPLDHASDETLEEKQKARPRRRRSRTPQKADNGTDFRQDDDDSDSATVDDGPALF